MAASFRSAGTWSFTANNVANNLTLTPGAPSGKANGDLLVLVCESRSITATVATPNGWNVVSGFPKRSATASGGSIYVFTRIATGGADDAPGPAWSGVTTGTSGDASGAGILCFQNTTETLDGTVQSSDLAAQTNTSVIPAFTTATAGSMVIGIAVKLLESSSQTSTVATFTERSDNSTTSGTGHIVAASSLLVAGTGSSGTATVTWSATTSARALTASLGLKATIDPVTLTMNDSALALAAEAPSLVQANTLVVAASAIALAIGSIALVQANTLAVQDMAVGLAMESPTPEAAGITLVVADGLVTATVESPALVQANTIAVANAAVGTSVDALTLTQANTLVAADTGIALAVDSFALTQANILAAGDAVLALSFDAPSLMQAGTLVASNAAVGLAVEAPTLAQANTLSIASAGIASSVDSLALVQANTLALADVAIPLGLDAPTLLSGDSLDVADAAVSLAVDSPALTQAHQITVADAAIVLAAESVGLDTGGGLEVQDVTVSSTVDNVSLEASVTIGNSAFAQSLTAAPSESWAAWLVRNQPGAAWSAGGSQGVSYATYLRNRRP